MLSSEKGPSSPSRCRQPQPRRGQCSHCSDGEEENQYYLGVHFLPMRVLDTRYTFRLC